MQSITRVSVDHERGNTGDPPGPRRGPASAHEDYEPATDDGLDARSPRDIRHAFLRRAEADREISDAVAVARAEVHSWATIGAMLGTSGEAARQRYGPLATA